MTNSVTSLAAERIYLEPDDILQMDEHVLVRSWGPDLVNVVI